MALNARLRGAKEWYSPERDLLNLTPSIVSRGAAFAASRESALFHWLAKQMPVENIREAVRKELVSILNTMHESRKSKLNDDSFSVSEANWPVFQAIMCGAGIVLVKGYSKMLQDSRMTDIHNGLIIDAVADPDLDRYLSGFDELTKVPKL